jgi:hypothetical protein
MVFTGNKESCPNYDTGNLDMSYRSFLSQQYLSIAAKDPLFGKAKFNKTCFDICPTINDNDEPYRPTYIEDGICKECLNEEGDNKNPKEGTVNYLKQNEKYDMCHIASNENETGEEPLWFQKQQSANLLGINVKRINWSSVISESKEGEIIKKYWMNADRGMTDEEILKYIGSRIPINMKYILPEEYVRPELLDDLSAGRVGPVLSVDTYDFKKLRRDINDKRGSLVKCTSKNSGGWAICPDGTFGPTDIIPEEVEDFTTQMIDKMENEDTYSLNSFSDMLSGLQYDSSFEACVNDKLNTGDNDSEIQTRIAGYTSIKEFTNKDINYLKRKLRKIITMKSQQVQECMNLLNLGKSMCQTGVMDKTMMIGSLIFSIVGNDKIDIMNVDNDERYKINRLVDELGPLVPSAIKNIIAVSKEYESRVCNMPSNTTLLLERLYTDMYDKPNVTLDFSPYLDFSSLINMNDNVKFIKTIVVLVVFAFLFMHGSNLVIAFLSRGSKAD